MSESFQRTRIKFCGMVRAQDVRFASSLGVDALGLVFYPKSPRALTLDEALTLRRAMPSFVSCVGLFVNADPAWIKALNQKLGLDVLQFHGDETADQVQTCLLGASSEDKPSDSADVRRRLPYWRAIRVKPDSDLLESDRVFQDAEALLLDAYSESYGGTGKRFDWGLAKPLPGHRMILSGGLDAMSVGAGIAALSPLAVDVSSGIQTADPRVKSAEHMEQFVAAVRTADSLRAKL